MAEINIIKEPAGAILNALADADPGDEIVYFIGEHLPMGHKHGPYALEAYNRGMCILYQRRDRNVFIYIARKIAAKQKGKR
jgi:hypothetical protein